MSSSGDSSKSGPSKAINPYTIRFREEISKEGAKKQFNESKIVPRLYHNHLHAIEDHERAKYHYERVKIWNHDNVICERCEMFPSQEQKPRHLPVTSITKEQLLERAVENGGANNGRMKEINPNCLRHYTCCSEIQETERSFIIGIVQRRLGLTSDELNMCEACENFSIEEVNLYFQLMVEEGERRCKYFFKFYDSQGRYLEAWYMLEHLVNVFNVSHDHQKFEDPKYHQNQKKRTCKYALMLCFPSLQPMCAESKFPEVRAHYKHLMDSRSEDDDTEDNTNEMSTLKSNKKFLKNETTRNVEAMLHGKESANVHNEPSGSHQMPVHHQPTRDFSSSVLIDLNYDIPPHFLEYAGHIMGKKLRNNVEPHYCKYLNPVARGRLGCEKCFEDDKNQIHIWNKAKEEKKEFSTEEMYKLSPFHVFSPRTCWVDLFLPEGGINPESRMLSINFFEKYNQKDLEEFNAKQNSTGSSSDAPVQRSNPPSHTMIPTSLNNDEAQSEEASTPLSPATRSPTPDFGLEQARSSPVAESHLPNPVEVHDYEPLVQLCDAHLSEGYSQIEQPSAPQADEIFSTLMEGAIDDHDADGLEKHRDAQVEDPNIAHIREQFDDGTETPDGAQIEEQRKAQIKYSANVHAQEHSDGRIKELPDTRIENFSNAEIDELIENQVSNAYSPEHETSDLQGVLQDSEDQGAPLDLQVPSPRLSDLQPQQENSPDPEPRAFRQRAPVCYTPLRATQRTASLIPPLPYFVPNNPAGSLDRIREIMAQVPDEDEEVNTEQLAGELKTRLKQLKVIGTKFANQIWARSCSTLSEFMKYPAPWNSLKDKKPLINVINFLMLEPNDQLVLLNMDEAEAHQICNVTKSTPSNTPSHPRTVLKRKQKEQVLRMGENAQFKKVKKAQKEEMAQRFGVDLEVVNGVLYRQNKKEKKRAAREEAGFVDAKKKKY